MGQVYTATLHFSTLVTLDSTDRLKTIPETTSEAISPLPKILVTRTLSTLKEVCNKRIKLIVVKRFKRIYERASYSSFL